MKLRPSLLALTAGAAGLSAVANAVGGPPPEPTRLGTSIAGDLAARDRQAAQRSRALDLKEQAARAAEQRLRAAGAAAAAAAPARPDAPAAPTDDERYGELARIYQAMKPKAAAAVFEQLTIDVQTEVAKRMRERSTATIMAAMDPAKAAALTMAMARKGSDRPGWTPVLPAAPAARPAGGRAGR